MAYLVTGGTGYIGSYVVRDLLDRGKDIVCLQRSGVTEVAREVIGDARLAKVKVVQGDVSNAIQLFDVIREYGIDLIVHLGCSIRPTSELEPGNALRVNCIGMNNVLEAGLLFGLRRVVWTSAGHALGNVFEYYKTPIGDDDAIYRPVSMYGATKALNEFMARHYYQSFGVDSIGFRLQFTFGIGRWHGAFAPLMQFFRKAALNNPVTIGGADESQGFLYVENVSNLVAEACDAPPTKTRVFNLIDGVYTWRQVAETICRINPDARVSVERDKKHAIFKAHQPLEVDTTGVRDELRWKPKYSLEDGLKRIFNYFRQKEGMSLL